jgi:hypothetical protein
MTDERIAGRCHCGNIEIDLTWPADRREIPARRCGCTFCTKHGGVWTSEPRARLAVAIADPSKVAAYTFGTRSATFHVCAQCGVVPFVTSDIDGHAYAVVNVNTLQDVDPARLSHAQASFDGEALAERLARRARNWIADVRIARSEPPVAR